VVAPGVFVALTSSVLLFVVRPPAVSLTLPVVALGLIAVILGSTIALQGPAHGRLAGGFDPSVYAMLVRTNWIRTVAWTALAALDSWMLYGFFDAAARPE
jgi:hypothetical protein